MAVSFEEQLAKVDGTIRKVYMNDHQHRMEHGLLYYYNKANDLRRSTEILMIAGGPRDNSSMLAGMALEVLIKGIAVGLDNRAGKTHNLCKLADHIGVFLSEDERVILDVLTEHVIWAGRYTAPRNAEDWIKVRDIQKKQRKSSGKIADMDIPSRSVSIGTFLRLWIKFSSCFSQVQQSRPESAVFSHEPQ